MMLLSLNICWLSKWIPTFLSKFSLQSWDIQGYLQLKLTKQLNFSMSRNVWSWRQNNLLIRRILQKNRDCKEDYRLHEACSREDDDDHDEKRVVAGQACPMALRGILLQHLHFSSQEKSWFRRRVSARAVFSLQWVMILLADHQLQHCGGRAPVINQLDDIMS